MRRALLFAFLAVALCMAGSALAQVPTGSITGTVLDSSGLPIAGAEVKLTDEGTSREEIASTTELGRFIFVSLNSGYYKVTVTSIGFKTHISSRIKLDAGTQYSVPPIRMELGEISSTVTVEAGAQLVQTTNAQISNNVDRARIQQLPILDRNPFQLLQLQAGTSNNGRAVTTIHGQRTSFGNVTLDGINIQDNFIRSNSLDFLPNRPTINTTSEFTVVQQNSGSEGGLGSSQVSFVTPSGTNDWHGDAFWYHRNNVFAANDWFNNRDDVEKPKLIQNQLGGSAGGPIFRDKLFIYGEYEAFRRRQGNSTSGTVLTGPARMGIFTYAATCTTTCPPGITNGSIQQVDILAATGQTIDPFIAGLLANVPTTINAPGGDSTSTQLFNTGVFAFNESSNQDRDAYTIRSDWNVTPTNSISGTFRWNRAISERPDIDNTFNTTPIVQTTSSVPFVSAAWRWTPSARFANEVRGGFSLNDPIFDTGEDFSAGFVATGLLFTSPIEDFRRQGRETNTYSLQDNGSYLMGNHAFNFGYLNQWVFVKSFTGFNIPPSCSIGLSTVNTVGLTQSDFPGGISSSFLSRANSLLGDLAGYLSSCTAEFNVTSRTSGFSITDEVRNLRVNTLAFYGGDSWKVRPRLTFNYGIRWDYIGRFDEKNGLFLLPVIPSGQTVQQVIVDPTTVLDFAGGDSSRPIHKRDLNNFAPNIGLAWDIFGDGKTALRAGYSIHFVNDETIRAADNAASANNGLNTNITSANLTNTISSGIPTFMTPNVLVPRTLADTNAESGGLPNTIFTIDPKFKTPYVQQWNFSIAREVGWNTVVDVKYIGNKGTALSRGIDFNQVIIGPNGFLDDFNRARANGFLCLNAGSSFNPNCTLPGSQTLTVFPLLPFGGLLSNSTVRNRIQTGQAGDLASIYHFNALTGGFPFVPNDLASVADILMNIASSTYHAGVVEVRRQGGRGLYFQANYTWSKVLTNSDGAGQTNFDPFLDFANPGLDRARADYDLTHAFKGNFVYELPMGKGHRFSSDNPILSRFLSGWSITSIFTWQSGSPISILSNRGTLNRAGRSSGKNTAVALVSQSQISNSTGLFFPSSGPFAGEVLWFNPNNLDPATGMAVGNDALTCNTSAFSGQLFCNPEPGQLGNLGRRAFNGPTFFNWDFSVIKTTAITERIGTEFRVEFFNFPNHPTFFNGDEDINSTNFGVITSTLSNPRIIQMALRVTF